MTTIRVTEIYTPEHVMDLRDHAVRHHEEYGGTREFDSAAVCMHGRNALQIEVHKRTATAWLAYDGDKPIGYLAATLQQNFYSFRLIAVQQMWYVVPEYRGTRAAVKLVKAFEAWAMEHNCELIYMGVEHDTQTEETERTARLLERIGYKSRGIYAVKHIE